MPKELRKLVFTSDEVKAAAFDYCLRNSVNIPHTPIDELIVGNDDDAFLTLRFSSGDLSDPKEARLSRDQVGAAMIKFCATNKIPLPRVAQKILKEENGEVVLMVSVHWGVKPG